MKKVCLSLSLAAIGLLLNATALHAAERFVKTTGAGSGASWDDALSPAAAKAALESAAVGDTFYFAAGEYKFGAVLNITAGLTVQGGYPAEVAGSGTGITYPSATPTVFSGNNTHCVMKITTSTNKVTLKGITVKEGKVETGTERPGIHVSGVPVDLYYCVITDNLTNSTSSSNADAGGAALFVSNSSSVYCYKTVFTSNASKNRGGAIRMVTGTNELILESCLVSGNSITGDYGSAIMTANGSAYFINTTIIGNAGNMGAAINQGSGASGGLYLISSTVVNNTCVDGGVQGLDIRADGRVYACNTIITEFHSRSVNGVFNSAGNNIVGSTTKSGNGLDAATVTSDSTNKTFADIFASSTLADNGGYPQTIAPSSTVAGATVAELEATKTTYALTRGDVSKDQRGFDRSSSAPTSRGAYDAAAADPNTPPAPTNHTVHFNANGGETLSRNEQPVTYGTKIDSLPVATRTGYDFANWNTLQDGTGIIYTEDTTYRLDRDTTLYAQWSINSYWVYFVSEGVKLDSQSIAYNGYATTPTEPTRPNYDFDGWLNGDVAWNFATMPVTESITLTAKWTRSSTAVATEAAATLAVYPNPAVNQLTIANHQWKAGDKIKVYSITGSLAAVHNVSAGSETTISIATLPAGTYVVKLGNRVAKVIVR